MPLYEYECKECNCKEEVYMHHNDALPTIPCNECGGKMYKIVSAMAKTPRKWR